MSPLNCMCCGYQSQEEGRDLPYWAYRNVTAEEMYGFKLARYPAHLRRELRLCHPCNELYRIFFTAGEAIRAVKRRWLY